MFVLKKQTSFVGDPDMAAQVLVDFNEKFPQGNDKKSTKKRGTLLLSSYVHAKGTRTTEKRHDGAFR